MYAKCCRMLEAQEVFDQIAFQSNDNLVAWNSLIMGYAENDEPEMALHLFFQSLCSPDERTFVAVLKACTGIAAKGGRMHAMENGMLVHSAAARHGYDRSVTFVGNSLVDMYSKCGSMFDARMVFDRMAFRTVVAWNALLLGYAENGEERLALLLFSLMELNGGVVPDDRSFIAVLKACTNLAEKEDGVQDLNGKVVKVECLEIGRGLQREAAERGYDSDMFVGSTLVDMYSKCGSMAESQLAFDRVLVHDVVAWTALMLGYVENGEEQVGLDIFHHLQSQKKLKSNSLTFVAALKACIGLAEKEGFREVDGRLLKVESLQRGGEIHSQATRNSCDGDTLVANTLVDMYGKCGSTVDAIRVFESMPSKSSVSWNILLLGFAENGEAELALEFFSRIKGPSVPEARSFVAALKACTILAGKEDGEVVGETIVKVKALEKGMTLHAHAVECGLERDVFVVSSLVDMYSRCGRLLDARRAFDKTVQRDLVLWTSLMLGYVENGEAEITLGLFSRMQTEGLLPNSRCFTAAIKACSCLATSETGKQIDDKLVKVVSLEKGMALHFQAALAASELFVANALVDMYANCGSVGDSRRVFERMQRWDSVSWTALISGYAENAEGAIGFQLFAALQQLEEASQGGESIVPSCRLFVAALKACSSAVLLESGRQVHAQVCRWGMENDEVVINCLIDLYGKCGSVSNARRVFDSMVCRSHNIGVVAWNSLMTSYGRQGDVKQVLGLFHEMMDEGVEADGVTFICVLTTCSHAGLVDEGLKYFEGLITKRPDKKCRRWSPKLEHYHCVIDLLGRSNRLEEALEVVRTMPHEASGVTWITVLGACQKWNNVEVGRKVFERLIKIQERDEAAYSLMMNIYASAGMWKEQLEVEELRVKAQTRRKPG